MGDVVDKKVRKAKIPAIVCDLDDTICDFVGGVVQLYNKRHKTCISPSMMSDWNWNSLSVTDARGTKVTGVDLRKVYEEYEPEGLYACLEALPFVAQALDIIQKLGYKIIIITARGNKYGKQTELNLLTRRIPHDEGLVFFKDDDKEDTETFKVRKIKELSKTYKIAFFADDKPSTAQAVQEGCNVGKVFLINKAHNRSVDIPEDVLRIDDLLETVRYLKDVSK